MQINNAASQRSAASVRQPEDWPAVFTQYLNDGDLNAVMDLYDDDAYSVDLSGKLIVGRENIKESVAGLIQAKARLQGHVVRAITVGDISQLYTDFNGTTTDAYGYAVESTFKAIEVLRRQPDGSWLLIIGDPNGRS